MPRVPQYQQDDTQVHATPGRLVAPDVSSGAMDLARGVGQFGAGVTDLEQAKAQATYLSSDTQARAQALADQQAVAQVHAQYTTLKGQNAVDAQSDALKQVQRIRDAGLKAMGTPLMQKLYTEHSGEMYAGATSFINAHYLDQVSVAHANQLSAETSVAQDAAAGLYQDPAKFGAALDFVSAKARAEAQFNGFAPGSPAETEYVKKTTGEVVRGAIRNALATDVLTDGGSGVDLAKVLNSRFGGDKLPFAVQQEIDGLMKEPLQNREALAIVSAARAGSTAQPAQDQDGNWIVPKVSSPAAGTGAPGNMGFQLPVTGARVTSGFGDQRPDGEVHKGVDLAIPVNTPIVPAAQGKVIQVGNDDRSGNFVVVQHPNGFVSSYAHMGNVSVKQGDQVDPNTVLGTVGLTGHTTGAHVHFRMKDAQGNDIDPMSVMGGRFGTVAAVTKPGAIAVPDETKVLANIDAMGLPPEMAQRAKKIASQQFDQERSAQKYADQTAAENANTWAYNYALAHGNQMPSPNMVPAALLDALRPDKRAQFEFALQSKADEKQQETNYANAMILRFSSPQAFAALDLNQRPGDYTPDQWNELRVEQAKMKADAAKPVPWEPYSGAWSALETFSRFHSDTLSPTFKEDSPIAYSKMLQTVQAKAEIFTQHTHRAPTESEWQEFALQAARNIPVSGILWGYNQKKPYNLTIANIPDATRQRIVSAYQRTYGGAMPSDDEIVQAYRIIAP